MAAVRATVLASSIPAISIQERRRCCTSSALPHTRPPLHVPTPPLHVPIPPLHPATLTLPTQVMAGQLKTGEQIRAELKASIASLLQQRGGSAELALPEAKPAVLLVRGLVFMLGWFGWCGCVPGWVCISCGR